jgi:hypothetical protein
MVAIYWMRARRAGAALCSLLFVGAAGIAAADTLTINPLKSAYATDGGLNNDPVLDGTYNWVYSGPNLYLVHQNSQFPPRDTRSAIDFVLPPALLQPGVRIDSAILTLPVTSESVQSGQDVLTISGLNGSEAAFVGTDFATLNAVATQAVTYRPCCTYTPRTIELKNWVQDRVNAANNHATFLLSVANWGTNLTFYSNATLAVQYHIQLGELPTLEILAPANGSNSLQGQPLELSAVANDAEDGDLGGSVLWTSSKDGVIGTGSPLVTSSLHSGIHVITAKVTDTVGNSATRTVSVTIEPVTNTVPGVAIVSPADGATYTQGATISFQANADDVEDGNLTPSLTWSSNLSGSLGLGGSLSLSSLPVGAHQITAAVNDTAGNTGSAVVNIVVQAPANTAPTVTITAPTNNAALTTGVSFSMSGTANDQQQGNMGSSIQWILDGTTTLATGASASAVISNPGGHTITARVTDAGGLVGSQTVNVTVSSPPPPSNYCALRGTTSSYEWIGAVKYGAINNVSGNNGGYRDYTTVQFNMPAGANSLLLTPGFSSGTYTEKWSVYLDLNRDRAFTASELLYTSSSSAAVTANLSIPATAAAGVTRMRVVMSYGSATPPFCGSFSYGEVEDYTVNIQTESTPPPGPTYCASRGNSTSYEWINQVSLDSVIRATGNNNGYADYTAQTPFNLTRNVWSYISLYPGFNSQFGTSEGWMVWIDYNKDGQFVTSERVVWAGSNTPILNNGFLVPATATTGVTRMRVQMKFGYDIVDACEVFSSGEVEDYSVNIQ